MRSVYIAGPMAGMPNRNKNLFMEVEELLVEQGWEVKNPARYAYGDDWTTALSRDLKLLCDCDSICLLPNWQLSPGAELEYRTARDLQKNILFWDAKVGRPVYPSIIGVGGYARSGKDEFARGLTDLGFTRIAFADPLKQAAYKALPDDLRAEVDALDEGYTNSWDGAKQSSRWRSYIQRFGTEAIQPFDRSFWVKAVMDNLPDIQVVIPDVRFAHEINAIEERGGVTVWLDRPGVGPKNGHSSENSLQPEDFHYIVTNNSNIQSLHKQAHAIAKRHPVTIAVPEGGEKINDGVYLHGTR